MPKHNTPRAQEYRATNANIVTLASEGHSHRQIADKMGTTYGAVEQVLRRHRRDDVATDEPRGETSTQRSNRTTSLAKAGFIHVSGWVDKRDGPKFAKLVAKAADEVERVTKGEDG